MYLAHVKKLLTPPERRIFRTLSTPQKIQSYLDALPINFEPDGETNKSPRLVIRDATAHCLEGAVFAATALLYHGHEPLLMDFRTTPLDEDHVIAPFRSRGLWGAISKTNHAILRWRDAVYRSPRELAMSYFHEYLEWDGRKSLREYSAPFNLSRFAPERWVADEKDLDWLVEELDASRHFPIAPKKNMRAVRHASELELKAMRLVEWKPTRTRKNRY